jgi:hypothetical protein
MSPSEIDAGFTSYQKLVVALMAFLQFSIILDFMVMSPLGAMLMPELQITPSQFGLVVSVYAFSAGLSAILATLMSGAGRLHGTYDDDRDVVFASRMRPSTLPRRPLRSPSRGASSSPRRPPKHGQ